MVPRYNKLVEFSGMLSELIADTTEIDKKEMEVVFIVPHNALQKLNEEFFYATRKGKGGKPTEVKMMDIQSNGIRFIYREMEEQNVEEAENKPAKKKHRFGFWPWKGRKRNKSK